MGAQRGRAALAADLIDEVMEFVSFHAIDASADLARERGAYPNFAGSRWSAGMVPFDTLDVLAADRGAAVEVSRVSRLDWDVLREKVAGGIRNATLLAIAPTASAQTSAVAKSAASSIAAIAAQAAPSRASGPSVTPSKCRSAARKPSIVRYGFSRRPRAPRSTANRLTPSSSPADPAVRAGTISVCAEAAPTTTHFWPLSTQPDPSARAVAAAGAIAFHHLAAAG